MPITTPSSPFLREIHGSRLHHWLPRLSWVPIFRRAGFKASTLCLMYLHPALHHKGVLVASVKWRIFVCQVVISRSPLSPVRMAQNPWRGNRVRP